MTVLKKWVFFYWELSWDLVAALESVVAGWGRAWTHAWPRLWGGEVLSEGSLNDSGACAAAQPAAYLWWQPWCAQPTHRNPTALGLEIDVVLCCSFLLFFFWAAPSTLLLPSKLFSQLPWVSKPVSFLSCTAGMALDWMSRHGARLDWTLAGSQPPGGATWLSNLQCWHLGRFNTTADGCLQPATRTVAPAASPGYPDSPSGKAGWQQDPAAPQDAGVWRGLGAPWACRTVLTIGWVLGVHRNRLCATQGDKCGEQSCQEIKVGRAGRGVCPLWELCRQEQGIGAYGLWGFFVGIVSVTAPPGTSQLGNEERFVRGGELFSFLSVSGF